jgi:hypothetical protein
MTLMSSSKPTDVDALESRKLEHLEAQLVAMFCPPLRVGEVQRCLIECVASYESAPVRLYLPVLVEREVTGRLRDMSRSRLDALGRAGNDRGMT